MPGDRATSCQIVRASSSRGMSSSRSAPLIVTESRSGKANSHSIRPLTTPIIGGRCWRRIEAEVRVDDGAEFRRRRQAGHQRGRRPRRHREDDGVVRAERDGLIARIERRDPVVRQGELPHFVADIDAAAFGANESSAGSISTELSPSRAISGRHACPPASSVSRMIAPASAAEPSGGSMLSAASSSGWTSRS